MTCRRKGWGGPIAWFVRRRPWSHRSKGPPATAPATPSPKPDLASCPRGRGICRQYRSRPVPARRRPILGVRISPSEVELPDGSLAMRRGGRHEKVVGIDKGLVGTPAAIEVVHEYRVEVTLVQDRQKSSDPCCNQGLCVPGTGILKSRSPAVS